MDKLVNDDIRRISTQLDNFYTAFRAKIYHSLISQNQQLQESASHFWNFQRYVLLYSLIVNWCEVFGANTQNNHWKELTIENQQFTSLLYQQGNYNYTSWMSYRKQMEEIKKSYLSNPDMFHHSETDIDFKGIEVSLSVTHLWLNTLFTNSELDIENSFLEKWPIDNLSINTQLEEEFHKLFLQHC